MRLSQNNKLQRIGQRVLTTLLTGTVVLTGAFACGGCARGGTGGGSASSGQASTAAGATAGVDMGEIVYDMLHHKYETSGETAQALALEGRHDDFVAAINRILPSDISNNLFPTLLSLLPLVDDGYVEGAVKDVDAILQDLIADQGTLEALAKLMSATGGAKKAGADYGRNVMISRLLAYPELEDLVKASLKLLRANDGMDDNGQPNGERNLLRELQAAAARFLNGYQPSTGANKTSTVAQTLDHLSKSLLAEQPMPAFKNLGAPAWAVRVDKYGNPQVKLDGATGRLPVPFVDNDGDKVADVNADYLPIDGKGSVIRIAAFGNEGTRDSFGRALAPGGGLYFDYYDAKHTLLSEVLLLVGELVKKDALGQTIEVVDKLATRYHHDNGTVDPSDDWETLTPDSPFLDLTHAQFQLVKATPLPQLLEGLAEIVKNDPAKFGEMVDKLVVTIATARSAAATAQPAASGSGGQQLVNDLLPLLEDALRPKGRTVSAVRALLQAFNSEQRRLKTLPVTFARMMKFHDYRNKIPADATHKSVMQRILEMMQGANQCSAIGMGNMADFYLNAMAGNQRILGINISIGTIHQLLDISFLRNLLCSNIKADDVRALQDFNDSGALDAMKPIAKVFSDRGETPLLKNIMLGLGAHYDNVMRPTEPTSVAMLESGAVEILFEVIDEMTQRRVPGSNEVIADVLADTLQAVIDTTTPAYDRKGTAYPSLIRLMMAPMDALSQKAKAAGIGATLDSMFDGLLDTLLATYSDDRGTVDPADDVERWKWQGLKNQLGDLLEAVADAIPANATDRARWAGEQQQAMENLLTGRHLVLAIDVLKAIHGSPEKATVNKAIANLFTPQASAQFDVFGAILVLAGEGLGSHAAAAQQASSIDEQALADVLHFLGRQIDPAANRIVGVIELVRQFVRADDGLLALRLARNAMDMGPNGTDPSAVEVLGSVFDDISAASGPSSAVTADSLRDSLVSASDFINDSKDGLPSFINRIKARRR
ncbi:MAG: hypothetical protein AB7N76_30555 [Planctomycetota bacterium]